MKRSHFLRDLSREHHTALSLANRIAKADDERAAAGLMKAIAEDFPREIDPHFRKEEEDLLVRLAQAGEEALVRRTLAEHRHMRDLAARLAAGDASALKDFGIALREHVRFEERELFVAAEAKLGDA